MPHLIGTAGHVDHGKTTLIQALTGIDADRLPEEKARGMTIDIGFAYADLPEVGRVSIVDVPGHERFLTNMLVGALGIDVALLCVAADESVMPQTREHLQILELLPVERMIVALTRADLADEETREFAAEEIRELLATTRFRDAEILPVSAHTGENMDRLKEKLAELMKSVPQGPREGATQPWYLPIDRAFNVKGHGCIVTGTLARGAVKEGDRAILQPGGLEGRIRSIQSHGADAAVGERGRRTALNLAGVKLEDVHRGMAIGAPGALFETEIMDARLNWVTPPKHGMRVRVSIGADEAIGKLFLNEEDPSLGQLRLERPVACAMDQPLVVRRYSPPDLLGGGRVTVPNAKARRKSESPRQLLESDEDPVVAAVGDDPNGTTTEEVCRLLGRTPQALGDAFERLRQDGALRGFAGLWFRPDVFEAAATRFEASLAELHEKHPTQSAHPRERVVQLAGLKWAGKPLDRILGALQEEGRIAVQGSSVRKAGFQVQLTLRQREFLDRVKEVLEREPVNVPTSADLARAVSAPPQAVEEILKLGVQAGELVALGDGLHYTRSQIAGIRGKLKEAFGARPFSAAEARDALSTSRKYVIPLLEHLDAVRYTLRVGDNRVIHGSD